MIGKNLGNRYRVLREIGSGGMAKVYLAEDLKGNELVAVKVLYPQFSEDMSFVQRFLREAKLASTLTDPHIVRVLDYGADRDLHYLVMEYVEGQNLFEILSEKSPFEWKAALEIIDQVATALEHAYTHGVVHRDIKPQNIMLTESGLLKILDFGIARIPTLPSLTQSGFIGSPYYASPEQAMGEEVDIRSDIYSLGIVLYELLSGNVPFDAKSPWSIISQHITTEPPKIELTKGQIPEHVHDLLDRMLAKRREERFQAPGMLRQAVAAVLAGQPVPKDLEAKSTPDLDAVPMIESLNERAVKAIEAEEWARAVDLLSQAAQLDPSDKKIAKKLTEVERTARLSSLYRTGHRAMASGRWDEAINHFNVIVELDPGYQDVSALLAEAHQALKRDDTHQFVLTRYREGLAHFEGERWQSAVEAFREVQQISPGYERVEPLLAEAEQLNNPSIIQKVRRRVVREVTQDLWRWSVVAIGIIIIIGLSILAFGNNNPAAGDNDIKQHLKVLYEEAQQAIENGNREVAVAKLEQILSEDPDYADAADIRRELLATATPTSLPTPTIITTPSPEVNPLAELTDKAQESVELALWTEAINTLTEVRSTAAEYQAALVSSLFCDAYAGRGLDYLTNIESQDEKKIIALALADFEAGATECPRRTDLKDQVERATAYLTVLNSAKNDYEALIPMLTPLVAADPDYADGNAKNLLYRAYLERGLARQESSAMLATALGDFEAALALNVDDPSEAQTYRAELLLLFSQQAVQPTSPSPAETATRDVEVQTSVEITSTRAAIPTVEPVRIKYGKPQLISPADDIIFAGKFSEVFLEWAPVGSLNEDEYYDLTIMYLFADNPKYTGSTRTRETRVQLNTDIGVGEAAEDRFYWWVTVRKDNSAPSSDSLDLPLSPRSDARTFVWAP